MTANLSIAYFPNIQYISKFVAYQNILIETWESYSKQSYRNRCVILTANGLQTLSVPVHFKNNIKIKDVRIDYSEDWQRNHYRAIMSAYKNSGFYDYFEDEIRSIIYSSEKFLFDFNLLSLDFVLKCLNIPKNYSFTEEYTKNVNFCDYRDSIHPKKRNQKADRLFTGLNYTQVFSDRFRFFSNLSSIDLILNEGPGAIKILKESINKEL